MEGMLLNFYLKDFLDFLFHAYLCIPTTGKSFKIIPFVVFEILDAIKLSEKEEAINGEGFMGDVHPPSRSFFCLRLLF